MIRAIVIALIGYGFLWAYDPAEMIYQKGSRIFSSRPHSLKTSGLVSRRHRNRGPVVQWPNAEPLPPGSDLGRPVGETDLNQLLDKLLTLLSLRLGEKDWFTGATIQAVTTGAYRAVEFIKANIKLEGATKANVEDSRKVVQICTKYAQMGMFNIFLGIFFGTLAFAFLEPFFFIGYLISIALFGLYQAIFMANAGGAWDNAKKIVETELKAKGTPLHDACVVGDTVGDPFKDTSSVAMNPVIKFTTLFGLLAVELSVSLAQQNGNHSMNHWLFLAFFAISAFFVWRSFYGMRINSGGKKA